MTTIGAKELRQNLDQVLDRVLSGEDIIVSHRFKRPIRLTSADTKPTNIKDRVRGLEVFDKAPKKPYKFDNSKPIKDLYDESITKKYIS
jgi:prevent-host-death family protein